MKNSNFGWFQNEAENFFLSYISMHFAFLSIYKNLSWVWGWHRKITVWHHNACQVMTKGDREGQIFLAHSHTNNDFFCSHSTFLFLEKAHRNSWISWCDITWWHNSNITMTHLTSDYYSSLAYMYLFCILKLNLLHQSSVNPMGESFQNYSWIQDFDADFPQKVSLKMLN